MRHKKLVSAQRSSSFSSSVISLVLVRIQAGRQETPPCLLVLTTDVTYAHFDSSLLHLPIGRGIVLSFSLWQQQEGRMLLPWRCNYITVGLAAPRPLTQLFLEHVNFIVSFEIIQSLSRNKSSVNVRGLAYNCILLALMHA